jgi:hypothetical protein
VPHQVRARGNAWQRLFQADAKREEFVQRLARLVETEALTVYDWAVLPNHFQEMNRYWAAASVLSRFAKRW